MKTVDLVGIALDWAVAQAEGLRLHLDPMGFGPRSPNGGWWIMKDLVPEKQIGTGYSPSTNWSQGGPIIDRELISIEQEDGQWTAVDYRGKSRHTGPTALIAAMRCYVQSKLADEVEIPEELL